MTQNVDGLMRLTGRSVNEPAGNPVSAEQWFCDGESNRQSDGISVTLKRFQPADPTGKHTLCIRHQRQPDQRSKRNADNDIAIDPAGTQSYWQYLYVRKAGNTIARYGYNPMGERTKKELPETGTTIHFLYNEQGLIDEYDDSGQLI